MKMLWYECDTLCRYGTYSSNNRRFPESTMMNCAMIEEQVARLTLPDLDGATTSTWGTHNRVRNGCIVVSGPKAASDTQDSTHIAAELHTFYMSQTAESQELWQSYLRSSVQYLSAKMREEYKISGARGQDIRGNISAKGINDLRQAFSTWNPAAGTQQTPDQQSITFNWQDSSIEHLSYIRIGDVKVQAGSWLLTRTAVRDTAEQPSPPDELWFVKVRAVIQHCRCKPGDQAPSKIFMYVDWYRTPAGRAWDVELQSPLVQPHPYAGHADRKSSMIEPCDVFPLHVGVLPHPGRLLVHGHAVNIAITRSWHVLQADLLPVPWQPLL